MLTYTFVGALQTTALRKGSYPGRSSLDLISPDRAQPLQIQNPRHPHPLPLHHPEGNLRGLHRSQPATTPSAALLTTPPRQALSSCDVLLAFSGIARPRLSGGPWPPHEIGGVQMGPPLSWQTRTFLTLDWLPRQVSAAPPANQHTLPPNERVELKLAGAAMAFKPTHLREAM